MPRCRVPVLARVVAHLDIDRLDAVDRARVRFVARFFVCRGTHVSPGWLHGVIVVAFMIIGCCCSPAWFIRFVFSAFVESTDSMNHSCGLPSVVLAAIVVLALITFVVVSWFVPSSCPVSSTLLSPSLLLFRAGVNVPAAASLVWLE